MASSDTDVAVIGGGASGIAAARRLHETGIRSVLVEARPRLGGRAWTITNNSGAALDLGCGWLHSADHNPWSGIAKAQGRSIDTTPPPWSRPSLEIGFSRADQREFFQAQESFDTRLDEAIDQPADSTAAAFLEPGCRWNPLMNAVSTYYSGAELDRVSARDLALYREDDVSWRVVEGLGATVAEHGAALPVELDCPVRCIDHSGKRLRIETAKGIITAEQAIVTLPSAILAAQELFAPVLPGKIEAAAALPLGLADKLFLSLENPEQFEKDSRLIGRTDRTDTCTYHLRPFGRPMIEVYFGGELAWRLEREGEGAFFDFAVSELTNLLGGSFKHQVRPIHVHRWGADPFARGSYSYARPGMADCRARLAAPVDERLFFAGEACSDRSFSTAHGAFETGVAAADAVAAARRRM